MKAYLIDNPFMNPVTEKLEVIILPSTLYEDITGYITQLLSKTNALSAQMQNQSKYPRIAPNPSEQAFLNKYLLLSRNIWIIRIYPCHSCKQKSIYPDPCSIEE